MRIVSGSLKAKQLILPKNSKVRPTTDKLRSAIFSILGDIVVGAKILDGFAGSGALGIESYSRGASFVSFVDVDTDSVKKNAVMIDKGCYSVSKSSFLKYPFPHSGYDIIFIDPPYGLINSIDILTAIESGGGLSEGGVIVYEEFYKTPFNCHESFEVTDLRKYGDTVIRFIGRKI